MNIVENIQKLRTQIPDNVALIAVSKFKSEAEILQVYQTGQRLFGENKAQEMANKAQNLPKDIQWHFIGHLQTNKIKYIIPFVTKIQSIDSQYLLKEVNRLAAKNERIVDCLLQFHIAEEETKFGFSLEEAEKMLKSTDYQTFNNIRICGVMGMATFTDNVSQIRAEFKNLNQYFHYLKENYFSQQPHFVDISMGMSDDYHIAIEEGATLVRIGSVIFGARNS
ncbi:MAG: YggS family pyridoxal phosphate-dependent enzyme [Bacteroidales bacterium]|nr:YggS family pyridoxal phosphate-dependent enzyme [Bacteroidales bacterium]